MIRLEKLSFASDLSIMAVEKALEQLRAKECHLENVQFTLVVPLSNAFEAGAIINALPGLRVAIVPDEMVECEDVWCLCWYPGYGVWSPGA